MFPQNRASPFPFLFEYKLFQQRSFNLAYGLSAVNVMYCQVNGMQKKNTDH